MATLAELAPRLARAHAGWLEARARAQTEWRRAESIRTTLLLEARRLEAHRELQLLRACAKLTSRNQGNYIARRQRKLDASREQVRLLRVPVPIVLDP